jgi:S-adenosylmethionine:tRNA ribosyltransferase-isomerase
MQLSSRPLLTSQGALPLSDYDYSLPHACIAQAPCEPRDASRLLCVSKTGPELLDSRVLQLSEHLRPGDLLIINETQVIPARLAVQRPNGGSGELLLTRPCGPLETARRWLALGRPGSALRPGCTVHSRSGVCLTVVRREGMLCEVEAEQPLFALLQAEGQVPLPPYLDAAASTVAGSIAGRAHSKTYQSIFAAQPGAVAAPTASLHFTPRLLAQLQAAGVQLAPVILHVGPGTFLPIRPEHHADVRAHAMHAEAYAVPQRTLDASAAARQRGNRVIAIGTTALRALETAVRTGSRCGESQLFILPGEKVLSVDGLLTNFHQPRSTLLLLVAALMGRQRMLQAYAAAQAWGYRFLSYGDAMLIT